MANLSCTSPVDTPDVADFISHLKTLLDHLETAQNFRAQIKNKTKSNHMVLQDKKNHYDAQNAADAVSDDFAKLLHPGLGFQNWKLTVKSGAKTMRWARAGSGGRGGSDVDAKIRVFLERTLCAWVSTSIALLETPPESDNALAALGLSGQNTYLFDITTPATLKSARIEAPTPALAYLRGRMLGKAMNYGAYFYNAHSLNANDLQEQIREGYINTKEALSKPPSSDGKPFEWSVFQELKLRLEKHPAIKALCSPGALDVLSGQIGNEDRHKLGALALSMANQSRAGTSSGKDLQQWVVSTGQNPDINKAFWSPDPAGAVMAAAIDCLCHGPSPSPSQTWRVYPVSISPDTSLSIPSY